MGRRSGGGGFGGGGGGRRPMFGSKPVATPSAPARPTSTAVAGPISQQKQPSTPAAAQGGGGGFLSNMMSTAGGVALGHTIGHAITGGGSGAAAAHNGGGDAYSQQPQQQQNACQYELDQFINCSSTQRDLSLCTAFNDIYKQCKTQHGLI
ncbi:uncharacterized protein LOC142349906 [Convolutriloba macropyga]|uniref:uncharacterized protein LOC142349906 n=1 Tax=Convolutriloba macropyga TaxID=536237 RepID=UPI003F527B18